MSAQPQPIAVPLIGGMNEKVDLTAAQQPVVIENARYQKSDALSKRNGYAIDTSSPLPTTPLSGVDHEYVAFDGDKFVARKTPDGLAFYQRRGLSELAFVGRDQREIGADTYTASGTASRLRPQLSPLPSIQAPSPHEGLICDLALPAEFMGAQGQVYVYVRLEQVERALGPADIFDIVVEYLDAGDSRLSVREPSRLRKAVTYGDANETHRQVRVLQRGLDFDDLTILFSHDQFPTSTTGTGVHAYRLSPGIDAASDVWSGLVPIVTTQVHVPGLPTSGATPSFRRPRGGAWDADAIFPTSNTQAFGVIFAATNGIGYTITETLFPLAGSVQFVHSADVQFSTDVPSIAMTGLSNGTQYEVAFAYVGERGGLKACYAGRFNTTLSTVTGNNALKFDLGSATLAGEIRPHSAVAGRFRHLVGPDLVESYLAGFNGPRGFEYLLGDNGQPELYTNVNVIACAWATGRPHTVFNFRGDFVRVVMPMVSTGGVIGGGTGLLADVTPRGNYTVNAPGNETNGAPLVATYAIDQITLSTQSVSSTVVNDATAPPLRIADYNGGLLMKPIHGSEFPFQGDFASPRWLCAIGSPPTATMLAIEENNTDFEFLEPGVMVTGAGVPLMLDSIHGLSELGFHSSPTVMMVSGFVAAAGQGYPLGAILQYRFQYRFVDGAGRAQVSPLTDPILVTSTVAETTFNFGLAPLDVTLRHLGAVVIDCYRTDDRQATFYWYQSVAAEGGRNTCESIDGGPSKVFLDRTRTPNIENFFMTPPCATHAFKGAFRDVLVTRENELWPSKRRLSTTVPQFDIVDAAAWDSSETVVTGGEIDGKLVLFSRQRIAYTYEMNGLLAPFVDIPSDTGAVDGSRAFSTHLGVFYQSQTGIRIIGRDLALHEIGLPVTTTLGASIVRGGIKVPAQGEIRLRLDDGRTYLVFDYIHGAPDQPVWYVTRFNEQGGYTDEGGRVHASGLRAIADQAFTPDGRLLYLCRLGFVLVETVGRYRDENQWVPMRVRSGTARGQTPLSYLATIEGAINLELPAGREAGPVTLRLFGDYPDSVPTQPTVMQTWTATEIEAFDRRQIQITSGEKVMNAPAVTLEYSDENLGNVSATTDGYGYRLSSMVMVYGPRDQKTLFPVANGARK